jgi:hypothetical protein
MPGLAINTTTAYTGLEVGLHTPYNSQKMPRLAINTTTACTGLEVGLLTTYNSQRCQS